MKTRLALLVLFVCSCSKAKTEPSQLDAGLADGPASDGNSAIPPEAGKADASPGTDALLADATSSPDVGAVETGTTGLTFTIDISKG